MITTLRAVAAMFGLLPGWLWASLLAGAVLHGCWVGNRRDAARHDLQALEASVATQALARARVALEANSNFRKFEHQQAATAAEIEHANQIRKAVSTAVDGDNRRDVDGVRSDVARLDAAARGRELPGPAACPAELAASRRAAENARGLLAACAAEYQSVAGSAQRDAIDLVTGVSYVDLVHAPAR